MKRSFVYLFIALVLTAVLIIYHQLGGFQHAEITYSKNELYQIAGFYYEGDIQEDAWETLFTATRKIIKERILTGTLTIVWYQEPDDKGISKAFIGILYEGRPPIPEELEVRKIEMSGVVRATLRSHVMVMPGPQKVVSKIKAYAEKNNFELQAILIEKYPEESLVIAEVPVK